MASSATKLHGSGASVRQGSQVPQFWSAPEFDATLGREAVDLAASAGLKNDPWQEFLLMHSLGIKRDGSWSAFEAGVLVNRQNGKGSFLESRVLAGLNLFGEKLILWSAHETKTAFQGFNRCVDLFTNIDELRKQVKAVYRSNGKEGITMLNGAQLLFVARSKGSGRGFSADCVILDEAYALTPEQMSALIPTLSARPNPQILYTSTPPLDGASGLQLYELRKRAKEGDPNLAWFDWGVQDVTLDDLGQVDLDDRGTWYATNPAMGYRISESFVARERATLPDASFARERLGIWPRRVEVGEGVIDEATWNDLAVPPERPIDVVFAVDVNPARTHAAISGAGALADGRIITFLIDYRPGLAWVADRLAQLAATWQPLAFTLDMKGPVSSLALDIADRGIKPVDVGGKHRRGALLVPTAGEVAQAFGIWVDAVRQKRLVHTGDVPLNVALAGATTRPLAGGKAWDRKSDVDICPLVASTVAVWAYTKLQHLARANSYDPLQSVY